MKNNSDMELCREGDCPRKATTIIESKVKTKTFKYYLCNKHWDQVLTLWLNSKGFNFK